MDEWAWEQPAPRLTAQVTRRSGAAARRTRLRRAAPPARSPGRIASRLAARSRWPADVTASESGERPASAEGSPTEPEPELTPREARQRERESRRGERP